MEGGREDSNLSHRSEHSTTETSTARSFSIRQKWHTYNHSLPNDPLKGHKIVCQSLEEFHSLLSDILQRSTILQDPWRSGFLCVAKIYPLHLLNSSKNPGLMCQDLAIAHLSQLTNTVPDTACFCLSVAQDAFVYCSHYSPLWVE